MGACNCGGPEEPIKIKKEKKPRVPKEKKESKMCCLCGDTTSDYIIFQNGFVCAGCIEKEAFIRLKQQYEKK